MTVDFLNKNVPNAKPLVDPRYTEFASRRQRVRQCDTRLIISYD